MMVVWKGAPALNLNDLSAGTIVGAIFGVMGVTLLISLLTFYPFLYRRLVMEDWTLQWYKIRMVILTVGIIFSWVHCYGEEVQSRIVPKNNESSFRTTTVAI
jgi:hypothetical protein